MKNFGIFLLGILIATAIPLKSLGCTSWMVFSDFTKNNTNILHKNRDAKPRNIVVSMSPAKSPRKWISLGSGYLETNAGMNASGLAGAMNSGERCIDPPKTDPATKKSTPRMLRAILESCDTAKEAVAKLKELIQAGDYWHGEKGSTFFFCDAKEGYVCEFTAKYCSVQRFERGYTVRANIWQNPNMYELSRNNIKSHLNSSARAFMAIFLLNKALDQQKMITLGDIFDASRHCEMPKDSLAKRSLCGKSTNSGATLEVDRQYPGVLSTLYATIGPPRNTLYVPVPICVEKLHPAFTDQRWSGAAWKRFDKLGFAAPVPEKWLDFEKRSLAKYTNAKEEARKLLASGKRAEAVKLINTTAEGIWKEAASLLGI